MSARQRWGLRGRLVVAFVGVSLLAAGLSVMYSNLSMESQVTSAAEARLRHSARHFSMVAAVVYAERSGWTRGGAMTLRHLAELDSLAVTLVDAAGRTVLELPASSAVLAGASTQAPVVAGGQEVGRVRVSQANGQLLTPEEVLLKSELNRMHLIAGGASIAVALVVALYLALTLSRPLRRIRSGAVAMQAGNLDARVIETGDIEIREVAQALNRLAETLQIEEELRKESVADLAHELRTPVNGLLGRIEAAQDGVLSDDDANLAAMREETLRLSRLLDDLSALSDAQRPELLAAHEDVDLGALVARQVDAFADRFADREIELTGDLHRVVVRGDPGRLEEIVVNLLANALRYTDCGGRVTVRVLREEADSILEVADSGIGIAPEDLPHIFTRFWRGEKSRSRATGGAGIGLAIVQALVRAQGGSITVDSVAGKGSTFRVTLPAV